MIGRRFARAVIATAALVGLVVLFGPGAPRPEVRIGAASMITAAVADADDALVALSSALTPALDAGRAGSARVVAGGEAPGPKLTEAAARTRSATNAAASARSSMAILERARNAADPDAAPLAPVLGEGELVSIAAQFAAAAEAADEFAAMRMRSAVVTDGLEAAIAALDARDVAAAHAGLREARAAHDALAGWEVGLVTLPIWMDTTDAMIDAVERIVSANEAGDAAAAREAASDFAALAGEGATADRALRIAIGEGGSAVAAAPLQRLASIMTAIEASRAAIASLGRGPGA